MQYNPTWDDDAKQAILHVFLLRGWGATTSQAQMTLRSLLFLHGRSNIRRIGMVIGTLAERAERAECGESLTVLRSTITSFWRSLIKVHHNLFSTQFVSIARHWTIFCTFLHNNRYRSLNSQLVMVSRLFFLQELFAGSLHGLLCPVERVERHNPLRLLPDYDVTWQQNAQHGRWWALHWQYWQYWQILSKFCEGLLGSTALVDGGRLPSDKARVMCQF